MVSGRERPSVQGYVESFERQCTSPGHQSQNTASDLMAEQTTFWPDFNEDGGADEDQAIDDFLSVLLEIDSETLVRRGRYAAGNDFQQIATLFPRSVPPEVPTVDEAKLEDGDELRAATPFMIIEYAKASDWDFSMMSAAR